jgi:ATP-dependent DNA helicase RecG
MRPDILNPLFAETSGLDGVGPKLARPLERLGLTRVRDLAYHLPERFVSRRVLADLDEGGEGEQVILALTPVEHRAPRMGGRGPYRVLAQDARGNICALTWFGKAAYTAKKLLPVGETRWVAGRLDRYGDMLQIVHPDHIEEASAAHLARLNEPVYRLSEGLTQPRIAGLVAQALTRLPELPEWIEPGQLATSGWPAWHEALALAHSREHPQARERLAYDELLANSLALLLVKAEGRRRKGQALVGDGALRDRLVLPFALTGAQARSIAEIAGDMAQDAPMLRLLQGDVGAGKTVVALHAMLIAAEAGKQAALLAPTELLARQHFETLRKMAAPTGVAIALFTGRDKGRVRESILMGLVDGSIQLVVGTHAIFQEAVQYRDLGLVVIDEQHRFGVAQRLALAAKGRRAPHTLAMTATPIPRSLTLAQYGEMDVSRLDELPPGRQAIDTRVVAMERVGDVVDGLARRARHGRYRGCRGTLCRAERAVRRSGGAGARPAPPRSQGCGDGTICQRAGEIAGGNDGDRSWRRCSGRDADGDRAGRTLRPCPIAPAARAGRAGRGEIDLPLAARRATVGHRARAAGADARDAGRVPDCRGGS